MNTNHSWVGNLGLQSDSINETSDFASSKARKQRNKEELEWETR